MKRKLFGLLLAVTLILSCFVGIEMGASAEGANKIVFAVADLTVEELGVEGAIYAEDIMGALSVLDANSRKHASDVVAEIHFKGNTTGGDQGNLLFAQKTIWREDGTKLPISIIGHDTSAPRDAYIYLDGIGGWYTCANDYTFVNLTLPVGDQVTYFYAGSGNVRMDNVKLLSGGEVTIATVADRTNQYMNAKAAAEYVVKDVAGIIKPDVGRLPCGDAWYTIRTSEEYMATGTVYTDANGDKYVDKDLTGADGSLYGDYSHAGNTGGGQYLNACVYYEAILGLDCRENDWTPTKYKLDPDLQKMLQEAAHAAVLEVYGEDHFKNPVNYERQGDGVVNLLMMGSSSSFYMRDELHFMAEHIGIKFRVVHAYSSGIKMSTQWAWTRDGNGKWTVYTEWNGETTEKKDQKMTDFVALWDWDAIVTYETGGSFGPKKVGYGYNETTIAASIKFVDKADEFINYVYDYNTNNANARYFWFNTVGAPVGAPGPSDSAEGFIFADNNTSAAYYGWTQADLDRYSENGKVVSSLTLGESMSFGSRVNAVGYMLTAPEAAFTDATAAEVEFIHLPGFETDLDVRPVNTLAKLIVDADTAATDMIPLKRGYSPASVEFHIKKGSAGDVQVYGFSANDSGKTTYGDVTIRWTGGSVGQFDLLRGVHLTGSLKLIIDPPEGTTLSTGMIRMSFNTPKIGGDVTLYAKNCDIGSVYSGGGNGTVTNTLINCNVRSDFFAVRTGSPAKVINTITNTTIAGRYNGGHWVGEASVTGPIINTFDGSAVTGVYNGGSYTGGSKYTCKVNNGSIVIDGKTETLAVYNNIKDTTVGNYYGGSAGGTCGNIRNDIDGLTAPNYYGAGGSSGTSGNIVNNIKDATITTNFYGGSASKSTNATKNITTDVQNIAVTGNFYGGNLKITPNGTISTTIRGGTITGKYYGGNAAVDAKAINNTVYGGKFVSAFYGGNEADDTGAITNVIHGGEFDSTFFGGMSAGTTGAISNTVYSDATFKGNYYGGSDSGTTGAITNIVHGGTFKKYFYAACYNGTIGGDITNTVYDIALTERFGGAGRMGTVNGSVINNVYGGTMPYFNGGFLHGATGTVTVTGDIISTIKGDVTISKTFSGATLESTAARKSVVKGTIVNVIEADEKGKAPVVGSPASDDTAFGYYGGGHHTVAEGGIVNIIKAGTFKKIWQGSVFYLGVGKMSYVPDKHVPEGVETGKYSTINLFLGGNFVTTKDNRNYVWGGICGKKADYDGDCLMEGGVFNLVDGATFDVRFVSGNRSYSETTADNPIVSQVLSGTFNGPVYFGGAHLGSSASAAPYMAIATIEGGVFNGDVYNGQNNASPVTNAFLTVKGGIFNGTLYAGTSGTPTAGAYTLTIEPTAGDVTLTKVVAARNSYESLILKGGDKKICIDSDAGVYATEYDGAPLTFLQNEKWVHGNEYVKIPASANAQGVTVLPDDGNVKMITTETESVWIGDQETALYGVNLILEQKIGLRVWLNKAEIDALGEIFTFKAALGEELLASYTYSELLAKAEVKVQGETEFYTLILGGVAPAHFHETITFSGEGLAEAAYSINDILAIVITNENSTFGEGFVTLAKTLWNYGIEAYDRFSGETSQLAKTEISAPADATVIARGKRGEDANVTLVGRALVLREAVGIRYYLNVAEGTDVNALTFALNGEEIPAGKFRLLEESGDGYNVSVTIYVSAAAMNMPLEFAIANGDTFAGSYTDSVASICQQYRDLGKADAALCTAILRYIQAVPGMND